ncbi:MAG TPA: phosphopantetheine adenylyltransferase [Limnobacter sp.]|nr:phosphopantetheine adenylyltransferase [Limnobacter sp.]
MNWISIAALAIAAVIHFLPLAGLAGGPALEKLYGVPLQNGNLLIILQHRALLFGLLGALFVIAMFKTDLRLIAMLFGLVSTVGFILIAQQQGDYNQQVLRVVKADVIVVVALLLALANEYWMGRTG